MSTKYNNSKVILSFGDTIRQLRKSRKLPLRKVAALLDIDQSYLSKIERGEKLATKEQIDQIAKIFNVEKDELILQYLSDKIIYEIKGEELAEQAIKVAEKKLIYGKDKI